MDMQLFTKIIFELGESEFSRDLMLGLFAEPLADPLLEKRLRLVKARIPKAIVTIPTNCGMFDPKKHDFILELADIIPVHVEGISPEVYDRFMDPLTIDRVLPRIHSLLELDKEYGKVHITTPVHKGNLKDIPAIRDYFRDRVVRRPAFTRLENRSWDEGPWNELSLAPVGGHCRPEHLLREFFVDWDGVVLACCSDFWKSNRLGDLRKESIAEVVANRATSDMIEVFRTKQWCQKDACSRCRWDDNTTIQSIV
jgi:radical SAM protein with 4Fe4S-binding SPASM domain